MKTSELTDRALGWAVAKCEAEPRRYISDLDWDITGFNPTTNWSQGGPIIERERININDDGGDEWKGDDSIGHWGYGPTPLIAAMRCYVASKLGDEVEIPEELK